MKFAPAFAGANCFIRFYQLLSEREAAAVVCLSPVNILFVCSLSVVAALVGYFYYTVCDRLYYLIVVRSEQHVALEVRKAVVYGSDAFKVEVECKLKNIDRRKSV